MLRLNRRIALSAAVSAALLTGAALSASGGATKIVSGHGQWVNQAGTIGFQLSVVVLPDGSIQGQGVSTNHSAAGTAWFQFEVTEYAYIGEDLIVVGLIDQTLDTPPSWLGSKTALLIHDDGNGGASQDLALSASGLPAWVTIEFILNQPPPIGVPPIQFWTPLQSGDFTIHD